MTSRLQSSADARSRWLAATARIGEVSGTLAQRFAEHTEPPVGRAEPARFDAWADAGLALRAGAGWRGDRLAQALFATVPRALPLLTARDLDGWVRLALHCGSELDESEFLHALPAEIAGWSDDRRR